MKFKEIPTSPTPEKKPWEKEFEEKVKIIEDLDAGEEKLKEIDEKRKDLDERYEATNDQEEREKIEKEHEQLSKQAKEIDNKISGLEKEVEEKKKDKSEKEKIKKEPKKERKKLNLLERYEKRIELLSDNIFSSLYEVIGPLLWNQDPEDPDYYLVQNQLKLSREAPVWVEKETKKKKSSSAKATENKEERLKKGKGEKVPPEEKIKEQLKEMEASSVIEKILQDPEALSKIFHEAFEISKNPEVQERFQELKDTVKRIAKEKEEIPDSVAKAAEFIKKEEGNEKKESQWGTALGAIGWSILLFMVLFMLLELKGINYLFGQTTGKKKETGKKQEKK